LVAPDSFVFQNGIAASHPVWTVTGLVVAARARALALIARLICRIEVRCAQTQIMKGIPPSA
jgi:hypothetical protein